MKTKQEILDFYGVEIGKKYIITKVNDNAPKYFRGWIFKIKEDSHAKDNLVVVFEGYGEYLIRLLNFCDYEEYNPILDDVEREYLQKYVMDNPAFKRRVKKFKKVNIGGNGTESCLIIHLGDEITNLPYFNRNSMYKGIEVGKYYTPQELGLEE